MGQRGVHATINKDETTGRFIVHLTTVQWSLHIAEIIKFALQHAGKDGYSQTEFLNCLEKTVRNMSHISAFDLMDEDYRFYNRSRPMEGGYSIVAHNHEDNNKEYRLGLDHGDGTFTLHGNATTFHTRRSAEKFVKEHRHAQDAVSYLWDLDSDLFTFFAGDWGSLRAYDFASDEIITCKEITYSIAQLKHPKASVEYNGAMSSTRIIDLYEGKLPA